LAASVEADGVSTDERGEWPMCGRYVSVAERADLVELYNATAPDPVVAPPSYNVALTPDHHRGGNLACRRPLEFDPLSLRGQDSGAADSGQRRAEHH
jgi:hypothetical protein